MKVTSKSLARWDSGRQIASLFANVGGELSFVQSQSWMYLPRLATDPTTGVHTLLASGSAPSLGERPGVNCPAPTTSRR